MRATEPEIDLEPQDIVVIGGTGSLARRKLLPALYDLSVDGMMPPRGKVIAMARSSMSDDDYRDLALEAVRANARNAFDEGVWQQLAARFSFVTLDDDGYEELCRRLEQPRRLIFLATPPSAFGQTAQALAANGLIEGTRLLIEKPFGRDAASAAQLDRDLCEVMPEEQVFRIDHYLGKETVQNILVFRFGNSLFERVWNRDAIDHIEITVAEPEGVDGRGAFYEEVGALRDVLQNHQLQLLSLLTMEPPSSFGAEAIRDEKAKLLQAVRPLDRARTVRGQYTSGNIEGRRARGYLEEEDVAPDSQVETFVATRVEIENWRWAGVPIFLRTGKRLPRRVTQIEIAFHDVPRAYFEETAVEQMQPNTLTISIQPEEKIDFSFLAKLPGPSIRVKPVTMSFSYETAFSAEPAEAYQRLIFAALAGDRSLFVRGDSVHRAWQIVQPILDDPPPLHEYAPASWGPPEADALIAPFRWHLG